MRTRVMVFLAIIIVALANLLPLVTGGMGPVVLAGAVGLLFVVGVYTGLDFSAIVKGSRELPKGQYREADKGKYFAMVVTLFSITVECTIVSLVTGRGDGAAIALYLFSTLALIAVYGAGMKANKAATFEGGV